VKYIKGTIIRNKIKNGSVGEGRPHPDCDDESACPFAPLPVGEGIVMASGSTTKIIYAESLCVNVGFGGRLSDRLLSANTATKIIYAESVYVNSSDLGENCIIQIMVVFLRAFCLGV